MEKVKTCYVFTAAEVDWMYTMLDHYAASNNLSQLGVDTLAKLEKYALESSYSQSDLIDMFAEVQNYIREYGRKIKSDVTDRETHSLINKDFNLRSILVRSGNGTCMYSSNQKFIWNVNDQRVEFENCTARDLANLCDDIRNVKDRC